MKKIMALFLVLISLSFLYSAVSVSIDIDGLDSIWSEGLRVGGNCSFDYNDLKITIPVRYGKSDDNFLHFIETGALIGVYPIDGLGFIVEASFLKFGYLWGIAAPSDPFAFVSEGSIGWDYSFGHFYIEPRLSYRSLISVTGECGEAFKKIPQFTGVRASLSLGVVF